MLKRIGIGLALLAVIGASAYAAVISKTVSVTVSLDHFNLRGNGSAVIALRYVDNATGKTKLIRDLIVANGKIIDNEGNVIANPTPAALVTAISDLQTRLDTMITNGANAGRLDL